MSAADDTPPPSSTIDHIGADDPVTVDQPQPEPVCIDLGGYGQWSDTFAPCDLAPTPIVDVATPPTLAPGLPVAGAGVGVAVLVAVWLCGAGVVLARVGRRRRLRDLMRRRAQS